MKKYSKKLELSDEQYEFLNETPFAGFLKNQQKHKTLKLIAKVYGILGLALTVGALRIKNVIPPIDRPDDILTVEQINANQEILNNYDEGAKNILNAILGDDNNKQYIISNKKIVLGVHKDLKDYYLDNAQKAADDYNDIFQKLGTDYHIDVVVVNSVINSCDITLYDDNSIYGKFQMLFQKSRGEYLMVNIALPNAFAGTLVDSDILVDRDNHEKRSYYKQEDVVTASIKHELGHALFCFEDNYRNCNLWNGDIERHAYFTNYDICAIASKITSLSIPENREKLKNLLIERGLEYYKNVPENFYIKDSLKNFLIKEGVIENDYSK